MIKTKTLCKYSKDPLQTLVQGNATLRKKQAIVEVQNYIRHWLLLM